MAPIPTPDANMIRTNSLDDDDNGKNDGRLQDNSNNNNNNMDTDLEKVTTLVKVPSDDITVTTGSPENNNNHTNNNKNDSIGTGKSSAKPSPRFLALMVAIAMTAAIATGIYFFVTNNSIVVLNPDTASTQNENYQGVVTLAELFTHNVPEEDCWLLIGNQVYDLTDFATTHPGGSRIITDICGSDGTQEYLLTHSFSLLKTIPEALIGRIEDDDGVISTGNNVPVPAPTPTIRAPVGFPGSGGGNGQPVTMTPTVFISEIHYDNAKLDVDQMIEVAFSNTLDISGYTIDFIRGTTQLVYGQVSLQAFILGDTVNGLTFASIIVPSLQNGPDGLALIDGDGNIVEFISYNGIVTSKEGPTAGMNSTDIGVTESGFDPVGYSLQKTGSGCHGNDFTWNPTVAESTAGKINVGMTVTCYNSGTAPIPAPTPWAETYAPTVSCYGEHYDYDTIALHATTDDCWAPVNGIVYDFTVFAPIHGGGPEQIWPYCGSDATTAFTNRHSQSFLRMITDYIIGYVAVDGLTGQQVVPCSTRRLLQEEIDDYDSDHSEVWKYEEDE